MGASNFYKKNASKIFAICESNDEEFDYSHIIENIIESIANKVCIKSEEEGFECEHRTVNSVHELRSYQSIYLCSIYTSRIIADIECIVQVHCFARGGYYDGACLDYEFGHIINCSNFDEIKDAKELFCNEADRCCNYNYGMVKIQSKNCDRWMKKQLKRMIETIESVYENCATSKLRTVAIFSNGETIYEKC